MDLNLNALIGLVNLVPIALTLRKIYAPDFDMPDTFIKVLDRLDATTMSRGIGGRFAVTYPAQRATMG